MRQDEENKHRFSEHININLNNHIIKLKDWQNKHKLNDSSEKRRCGDFVDKPT